MRTACSLRVRVWDLQMSDPKSFKRYVHADVKLVGSKYLSLSHLSMTFGPCAVGSVVTCPSHSHIN